MEAPKMMAAEVNRHNYDVCLAIRPELFAGARSAGESYGLYIVINIPHMVYTEGYHGIGFRHEILDAQFFNENYRFSQKNTAMGKKGFERVRMIYGGGDLAARPTHSRFPRRPYTPSRGF